MEGHVDGRDGQTDVGQGTSDGDGGSRVEPTTIDPLKVLLVGINQTVAAAGIDAITAHFGEGTVVDTGTPDEGADLSQYGIALLQVVEEGNTLGHLEQLLSRRRDLPVVLLSSEQGRDLAIEGIRRGAYDNVVAVGNYLATLPLVIEKNLAIWQTRRENESLQAELAKTIEQVSEKNKQLEQAVSQLETTASTDPLTGLHNRRSLSRALEQSFAQASRYGHDLTFLMIDLDHFKQINDTFGHQVGDEVLQMAAKVLETSCRRADTAGRYGGDEFVIILPETPMATAFKVAKRARTDFGKKLNAKFADSQPVPDVAISIGAASLRQCKAISADEMLSFADEALYTAKQSKNTPIVAYAKRVAIKVGAAVPDEHAPSQAPRAQSA